MWAVLRCHTHTHIHSPGLEASEGLASPDSEEGDVVDMHQIYECPFFAEIQKIDHIVYNIPVFFLLTCNVFFLIWIMTVSTGDIVMEISKQCLDLCPKSFLTCFIPLPFNTYLYFKIELIIYAVHLLDLLPSNSFKIQIVVTKLRQRIALDHDRRNLKAAKVFSNESLFVSQCLRQTRCGFI